MKYITNILILLLILIAISECSSSKSKTAVEQKQIELHRIEILKAAENSKNPAILEQAELIRQEIETEKQKRLKREQEAAAEKQAKLHSQEELNSLMREEILGIPFKRLILLSILPLLAVVWNFVVKPLIKSR